MILWFLCSIIIIENKGSDLTVEKKSLFTERLNQLREEKGIKQSKLAEELGISPQAVSYYMNGREPNYDTLLKIADYFDVTTDYLLGRSNSRQPQPKEFSYSDFLTNETVTILSKTPEYACVLNYMAEIGYLEKLLDQLLDLLLIYGCTDDNEYIMKAMKMGAYVTNNYIEFALSKIYSDPKANMYIRSSFTSYNQLCVLLENNVIAVLREIINNTKSETVFRDNMRKYYEPFVNAYKEKYGTDEYYFGDQDSSDSDNDFMFSLPDDIDDIAENSSFWLMSEEDFNRYRRIKFGLEEGDLKEFEEKYNNQPL